MEALKQILLTEQCSLVVRKGDVVRTYRERGVADLFRLFEKERDFLNGAEVADKVVGRAAAALMAEGGVARLHALTVSTLALRTLAHAGIPCTFDVETPAIANRSHTGLCPMETLLADVEAPADCVPLIRNKIRELRRAETSPTPQQN